MEHINRKAIDSISYLTKNFPCVAIIGARQTGKTTILKDLLPMAHHFDLERESDFVRIKADPAFFLSQYKDTLVIDEAQLLPALFPALRVAIDEHRSKNGRFLISGSSSPQLLSNISESLAGRVAIFELSTLSLEEAWQKQDHGLYDLLQKGKIDEILKLPNRFSQEEVFKSFLLGGYPQPFTEFRYKPDLFSIWWENYFSTYINRDVRTLFPGLNIDNYRRFVRILAESSGQILNLSDFASALDVSSPTVKNYLEIANGTFIWRTLPAYINNVIKQTIKSPYGYLRDIGLLNHLFLLRSHETLMGHPRVGHLWECFIAEELIKNFNNRLITVAPYYYRTKRGAEIDLILESSFGVLPIEIKLGVSTDPRDLSALTNFVEEHKLPYGVVINNSTEIMWLRSKILQLPVTFL
jgi:predicted AAA+ superfamily ATPase